MGDNICYTNEYYEIPGCNKIGGETCKTKMNTVYTLSDSSADKESACNPGDPGSIPGSGSSPGKGHGNPLQYSCLENPIDRGAWWGTVQRVAKSWTRLSD